MNGTLKVRSGKGWKIRGADGRTYYTIEDRPEFTADCRVCFEQQAVFGAGPVHMSSTVVNVRVRPPADD